MRLTECTQACHTASRPDLLVTGIERGKRAASRVPTSTFPWRAASINGVSQSALRDISVSSCPASTRSSYITQRYWSMLVLWHLEAPLNAPGTVLTTISSKPACAARCRLVLLLSLKSGFCSMPGLERMMRLTSKASDKRIALRSRVDASIILICNCRSRDSVQTMASGYPTA